jgi:tRNA(Ile2) C34 agmatinyltransferase TiaS
VATEEQISKVLRSLDSIPVCPQCKTRLRFGDYECPRCGHDIEDQLRTWAIQVIDSLES